MRKTRIALIVPSSNTTMEADFVPRIPHDRASFHVARMYTGEPATKATEEHMITVGLPRALEDIATAEVDLVMFGCTSAGTIHGAGTERELEELIQKTTKAKSVTVTRALNTALREHNAKRIIVFSPYGPELNKSVTDFMGSAGFDVIYTTGMAVMQNQWIAAVEPEEIVKFAMDALHEADLLIDDGDGTYRLKDGDAIVFSCTNLRAWECLEIMQSKIKTFFTSSNKALFDLAMRTAGLL